MTAPAVPIQQPGGDPPPRRKRSAKRVVNQLLWYAAAIILALFIFFPIYLIFVSATTPDTATYAYPKSVIPVGISTENIETFLRAAGVIDAFWRSVVVGIITVVLALGIGAPAGYAIARYAFRARNGYRLVVLATRAFPIVILSIPLAVMYRQIGIFDTVWGGGVDAYRSGLAIRGTHHRQRLRVHPQRAGRSGADPGLQPCAGVPQGVPAAGATRADRGRHLHLGAVLERRLRRGYPDAPKPDAAGSDPDLPDPVILAIPIRSRVHAAAFIMLVPSLIVIFIIRKYLLGLWGRVVK